ncbi:kelch-like ECH-associated protein 1B isoform X2 [Ictalurus punctatus]|uniref:Kelch-like ECH-associated protein 1B isoform X2 n=1 Tax=Ictalurus punctatus TaxID=7998 RepID=A0A2D0QSP2_ICTPU|nr:kelch-like ECH-associated protein 1B isoform X2 [Ictalurus punctatus]
MDALWETLSALLLSLFSWIKYSFDYIQRCFGFKSDLTWVMQNLNRFTMWSRSHADKMRSMPDGSQRDRWKMDQEARTYRYHGNGPMFTIQTSTYIFYLAEELSSVELHETVLMYLSTNLLELPHLSRSLDLHLQQKILQIRSKGSPRLCCLRKENLISRNVRETESARRLFRLDEDDGKWSAVIDLPFSADKWCFTTAVLFNYLYLIGGFRQHMKRRYEFKMASFRYNPLTNKWVSTAPLIKHRRHFSAAVCEGHIYAVGGWYLDSLVTPDSSTGVYTAVERYDPWTDSWAFVSSLPLSDFQFTLSLSHDSPLTTSLGTSLYVLGNIRRTGEKLVLRYDTTQDCWSELLPTLTRIDADMPSLCFLGSTDRLIVIGGNNVETVVTSFCVETRKWGQIRSMEKTALIGQGTVFNEEVYMSGNQDMICRLNIHSLSLSTLPSLPVCTCYESFFHLFF